MKRPTPHSDWPASWKSAYEFDRLELDWDGKRNSARAAFYQLRLQRVIELVTERLAPGGSLIDIGAAQGNFSLALAERGYQIVWNDLREELSGYVELKHEIGNVRYVAGNAFEIEERDFDGVLIAEIIEHVAHPDQFLNSVARLVRPGGYIFLTTPNGSYFRNRLPRFSDCPDPSIFESVQFRPDSDGHIFLLHRDELESIADNAGLEVEKIDFFANSLTSGHMKLGFLHRFLPRYAFMAMEAITERLPVEWGEKIHSQTIACLRKRVGP